MPLREPKWVDGFVSGLRRRAVKAVSEMRTKASAYGEAAAVEIAVQRPTATDAKVGCAHLRGGVWSPWRGRS
jgi:hypothetical protein